MARLWLSPANKYIYGENNCAEKQMCLIILLLIKMALEITVKAMVLRFSELSEREILICVVSGSVTVC